MRTFVRYPRQQKEKGICMNFKVNESSQKLSGSYYTPEWIAEFVAKWILKYDVKTILEPSCGDGVFFDAITHQLTDENLHIMGFDTDPAAISKCTAKVFPDEITAEFSNGDYLKWAIQNIKAEKPKYFDAVVGNPPFIRYQYLEKDQQERAQQLFGLLDLKFTKHTNAWIPFVISAIEFLKPGGVIGMVIPSEIIHVLYAQGARDFLLKKCSRILLLDPEDLWFEDTLQGAMLLMAQKKKVDDEPSSAAIVRTKGKTFTQNDPAVLFEHAGYISGKALDRKWTYALLSKDEYDAYTRISKAKSVQKFKKLASVDVGIVTGANKFFLVTDSIVHEYHLQEVAHPMFGRSEHCPGVIYDQIQHRANADHGYPTNFLYFENEDDGIRYCDYLKIGEDQEIPQRYKCRIRKPWFKVPSVYATPVSMLKRSNGMPRLILNEMNAYTTDTAYRIVPKENVVAEKLVYCFINTITALSAELEGRFYGGGVLELVPSEIDRVLVPYSSDVAPSLRNLDQAIRSASMEEILEMQDADLFSQCNDISMSDILILRKALNRLRLRRQRLPEEQLN